MVRLYYWYWNKKPNFGDLLTPLLFERLFSTPAGYAPLHKADVISVGSILQKLVWEKNLMTNYHQGKYHLLFSRTTPLIVWGSGTLHTDIYTYCLRRLDIRALRGHGTQKLFSPQKAVALGDPGLLVDKIVQGAAVKKYKIGIVPHYADKLSPWVNWLEDNLSGSTIIDVAREPLSVVQKIRECEMILSSSLHGLVVADSLGIPNQWVMFENTSRTFETWKYNDYYSVFDELPMQTPWIISSESVEKTSELEKHLSDYARPGLEKIQQDIIASFPF